MGNGKGAGKVGWGNVLAKSVGWKAGISAGNRLLMAIEVGDKQIYEN